MMHVFYIRGSRSCSRYPILTTSFNNNVSFDSSECISRITIRVRSLKDSKNSMTFKDFWPGFKDFSKTYREMKLKTGVTIYYRFTSIAFNLNLKANISVTSIA